MGHNYELKSLVGMICESGVGMSFGYLMSPQRFIEIMSVKKKRMMSRVNTPMPCTPSKWYSSTYESSSKYLKLVTFCAKCGTDGRTEGGT
jgi:hypothetical protein